MRRNNKVETQIKIICIILFSILIINPFINGALPQPVEKGSCVNIKVPYNNATSLNITTLTYPNQSMIFINATASLNGSTFFYNDFCDTDQIGEYTYEFLASDGFSSGNSFKVTETGDELNQSQSSLYVILLIINLLFLALSVFLSIIIPYRNKQEITRNGPVITSVSKIKYVKIFSMWASYLLFLWLITLIAGMVDNYIFFQPLKDMARNLYLFFNTIGYGLNVFMIWIIFINIWRDIVLNKKILKEGKAFLNELK